MGGCLPGTPWPYSADVLGSKVHRVTDWLPLLRPSILSRTASLTNFIKTLMWGDIHGFPKDRDSASHLPDAVWVLRVHL